ncbi:MAG TPA: hypothetical protein VNV41_19535 [Candidatus Acidoferrales bacterium]|jgi:hypothetical protein|nr:hypothetical protein [Candidatus Acidoferrales bacterium]
MHGWLLETALGERIPRSWCALSLDRIGEIQVETSGIDTVLVIETLDPTDPPR